MASPGESEDLVLANRLVGYADAIVAVAFLGVSGLGVTIADPDMRCTMSDVTREVAMGIFLNGLLFLGIVAWLRRAELDLREGHERSDKVTRYGRMLHLARYIVISASIGVSLLLIAQVDGVDCGPGAGGEVAVEARSAD